jgi:HEAT repeat protein
VSLSLLLCLLLGLHGGRFLPPLGPKLTSAANGGTSDGTGGDIPPAPPDLSSLPSLPGMGPVALFEEGSWEWWFDFNEEQLVNLRGRMLARDVRLEDRAFEPISDQDRRELLVPVLAEALKHRNRDMRATAAMSLGRLGLSESVPLVKPLVYDRDLFVRAQAVLALGASGRGAALETLTALADDHHESDELRVFALAAIALIDQEEAHAFLGGWLDPKRLKHENNVVRAGAVFAAGVAEAPSLLPFMLELADSRVCRKEASMQALLAGALGRLPTERALPALLIYGGRKDNQVRRSAAAGLQAQGRRLTPAQTDLVWERYADEGDWSVRVSLLRALAGTHVSGVDERLADLLGSTRTVARPHVALALGLDGDPQHLEPLLGVLEDHQGVSLRGAVSIALGLLGDPLASEVLAEMLENETSPQLQSALCLAVGLLDDEQADQIERLVELATQRHDVEVVRHAIAGLGLLGARRALDELSEALSEVRNTVDLAAQIYGLGLAGDRRQIASLVALIEADEQPRFVLRYALGALGDLGDPHSVAPASRFSRCADLGLHLELLFELYRMP